MTTVPITAIHWLLLAGAILLEVAGTVSLRLSDGFTKTGYVIATLSLYGFSFWLLAKAIKAIPLSVSYAIWSGAGTVLIAAIGVAVFGELMTALKLVFITLIVVGVVGLQLMHGPAGS